VWGVNQMKNISDLLICPVTHQKIILDYANEKATVEGTDIVYPIKNGIIDFLPGVGDGISAFYDDMAPKYDEYMLSANFLWKLTNLFTWGFYDDWKYAQKVLAYVPDDFYGVLLDVPVGTGVLTLEKYKQLNKAQIIAIDYSPGMLAQAKRRCDEHGMKNVTLIRADAAHLPIENNVVNLCLSMNGFHVFPEKQRAYDEIVRVLKSRGALAICFYVKGKRRLTDFLIQHVLERKGSFSAPYYSESEVMSLFEKHMHIQSPGHLGSILYFSGVKHS
jgi:ubiquinone/menaquinone biosynthesis C-methylase UbiE